MSPLEVKGEYARGTKSSLSSSQVGGVQMAHVEVDKETGVVKMKKFVAVQDIGLVIVRVGRVRCVADPAKRLGRAGEHRERIGPSALR